MKKNSSSVLFRRIVLGIFGAVFCLCASVAIYDTSRRGEVALRAFDFDTNEAVRVLEFHKHNAGLDLGGAEKDLYLAKTLGFHTVDGKRVDTTEDLLLVLEERVKAAKVPYLAAVDKIEAYKASRSLLRPKE